MRGLFQGILVEYMGLRGSGFEALYRDTWTTIGFRDQRGVIIGFRGPMGFYRVTW